MNALYKTCLLASTLLICTPALAEEDIHLHHGNHNHTSGAPIGIMGDHTHNKGDWMVSYRFKRMHMDGNRQGTNSISPEEIVTTIANPNAPPPTLRVVPTEMDMDMHMFGAMYGVTERLTVMAMAMYMRKSMDHITFAGGASTTVLGEFTTKSTGWGDTSVTGIYKLYETDTVTVNLNLGLSAPTGSIKEEDDVLTPMNTTPTLRLPYAMQLGSGTWDALPGITYSGHKDKLSWGAQYNATFRLEDENDQGYSLGDRHTVNLWTGYKATDELTLTALASAEKQGDIDGSDAAITAPVQTANPDNYGGERIDLGAALTYTPDIPAIKGTEIGLEFRAPVYQDLNGVQLETDWNVTAGIRYRF